MSRLRKEQLVGLLMVSPALILLAVFFSLSSCKFFLHVISQMATFWKTKVGGP
jgi:hypothetical protein